MSTVVLTPTHIGCDHNVVHHSYPHQSVTNINHRKIFISPNKMCLIGTVGSFDPESIDTPNCWRVINEILGRALADLTNFGLLKNMTDFTDEKFVREYVLHFDAKSHTFIVTRHYRFVVYYSLTSKRIMIKQLGDYSGIGTGGMIAAGMAMGTKHLKDVFKHLPNLDSLSSSECTVVPLSTLVNDRALNKKLILGRKIMNEGFLE